MLFRLVLMLLWFLFAIIPLSVHADSPITHTVAWGETLYSIGRMYNISPQLIANANGVSVNNWVYAGEHLTIPDRDAESISVTTPSGYYTVRAGDTLYSIASRLETTVEAISSENDLPANGVIYVGSQLKINRSASASSVSSESGATQTYIVQPDDNLALIALRFGTTVQAIVISNNLPNFWMIYAGQRLIIPRTTNSSSSTNVSSTVSQEIRVSNIPFYHQQQTLTCEESAAAMATRGAISEAQLLAVLPRNENPNLGIRGRTNAFYFGGLTDYGVYAPALQKGLAALGIKSQLLTGQSYDEFKNSILENLRAAHPIVWWHTWHETYQNPVNVRMSNGSTVKLVPYEHTSTIVAASERGATYHDPYDATVRFVAWENFRRVSAYFDNMALVIQ